MLERERRVFLKKLLIKGLNREVIKLHIDRGSIEKELLKHNLIYFKLAKEYDIYKDNIWNWLRMNKVRNRILNITIIRQEYDYQNMCEFLKLLKSLNGHILTSLVKIIIEEDLVKVVKRLKIEYLISIFWKNILIT